LLQILDACANYVVDVRRNWVIETHIDPEVLAQKLGVLADFEELVTALR
jgi:hypothetical protein